MGAAALTSPQPKTLTATAKQKRKKIPKPPSRCLSTSSNMPSTVNKTRKGHKARHKPLGLGTRPGAHKQLPIIIDGDDAIDADEVLEAGPSLASRAFSLPAGLASRIVSLTSGSSADGRKVATSVDPILGFYSSSATLLRQNHTHPDSPQRFRLQRPDEPHLFEERLCSLQSLPRAPLANKLTHQRQGQPANDPPAQPQFQSALSPVVHPRPWQGSGLSNALAPTRDPEDSSHHDRTLSVAPSFADDRSELTLADISDMYLRAKTAQLMCVAPGIPVADLYRLLNDEKGRSEAAKRALSNASQSPSNLLSLSPVALTRATTVPRTTLFAIEDHDRDEIYIKTDLNDPAFMWDNDVPATPPPEPRGLRQNSQAKLKKPTGKSFARPPVRARLSKPAVTCSSKTSKEQATKSTRNALKESTTKKLKGRSAGDINRGVRETSYDRSFIVFDDVLIEESDVTYSGSDDGTTSDTDMNDDETGLSIDMETQSTFNVDILSSPGHRR
ncbi:uncharacterized protein EKO05_0000752 [Ascochyta rabiei]|uniref:uncharacterized protein n=1 Tax=Didymella rabiei TaxID=5454 RepID=UPI0018FF62D4|nr:uncharacterized protein EKO05_0000752 [Ascochyta rabiei]UPX10080.1 hypothetical protein EKO05_0000752 [Ascochyta rabiei]